VKSLRGRGFNLGKRASAGIHAYLVRHLSSEKSPSLFHASAISLAGVSIAAGLSWLMIACGFPSRDILSLLFVLPVLVSAILYGLPVALVTVVLSLLAYNMVVLPPVWDFTPLQPQNMAKGLVLGIVAVIASGLSTQIRALASAALRREAVLSGVYALSQELLGISNLMEMRRSTERKLASLLGTRAAILLLSEITSLDEGAELSVIEDRPTAGRSPRFSGDQILNIPLRSRNMPIGVMQVGVDASSRYSWKLIATLAAQTASALDKAMLAEQAERQKREGEREAFLAALLSSVSHDFKTPLVTVVGVLSGLKDAPIVRHDPRWKQVVASGLAEALKLDRFIGNLVEISRLESGLESLRREPVSLRDLLASSFKTLHPLIVAQHFAIDDESDFPLLNVNPALMELVFLNVLENAIKYGPEDGTINIIARSDPAGLTIDVDDDGPGIPPPEREAVFRKFYRSDQGDRKTAGTGLGLYICRSIITVHGGTIDVIDPHDGKGACIRIKLPDAAVVRVSIEGEAEEKLQ